MSKHSYYVLAAAVLYSIAAFNSYGFHHPDEQFQILEFAGLKLGFNQPEDLAWEFHHQIRATVQPYLAELFIRIIRVFEENPFNQIAVIRLFTAIFGLFSINFFVKKSKHLIDKRFHQVYFICSYFLYFIPYIIVRFSSETISICVILIVLGKLLEKKQETFKQIIVVGALFGLSYLFRFQIIFMIFGIGLWMLFVEKYSLIQLTLLTASFFFVLGLGSLLDYAFYGEFTFTTWNYFEANIINKVAASFGVSPWYYYFQKATHFGPLSILNVLLILTLVGFTVIKPKNVFIYAFTFFVLAHSYVGHKELRFIYGALFLLPFPFVFLISYSWNKINKYAKYSVLILASFLLLSNTIGFIANVCRPVSGGVKVYDVMFEKFKKHKVLYFFKNDDNFRNEQSGLKMNFYQRKIKLIGLEAYQHINDLNSGSVIISKKPDLNNYYNNILMPPIHVADQWLILLNRNNWMCARPYDWYVYQRK